MWNWAPPLTIRMIPKPTGSAAKAAQPQGVLTKPAAMPMHKPKPEDVK